MKSASKSYNIESFADSDFVSESQLSFYFPTTQEYNSNAYGAQNEAYMSRSAEKWVRGLCFNELGVCG